MSGMKYVRLFAGPDGESHFQDVAVKFGSEPPLRFLVSEWLPAEQARFIKFPPSYHGTAHVAPRRQFIVYIAGCCGMQTTDGEIRFFRPGDVLLVEDTIGKGHSSWTEGDDAYLAAAIQLPS